MSRADSELGTEDERAGKKLIRDILLQFVKIASNIRNGLNI